MYALEIAHSVCQTEDKFLNFRESKNISLPDVVDGHAAEMNRIIHLNINHCLPNIQYINI